MSKRLPRTGKIEYRSLLRSVSESGRLLRENAGDIEGFNHSVYRFEHKNEEFNLHAFRDHNGEIIVALKIEMERSCEDQEKDFDEVRTTLLANGGEGFRVRMFKDLSDILSTLPERKEP